MNEDNRLAKTLQELEGEDWGEPVHNTALIAKCHQLRRVPLKDFTAEELRLMLGQRIGLPYLVPIALSILQVNPLTEGNMYPGDLLNSVCRVPEQFWDNHPELKVRLDGIMEHAHLSTNKRL